MYEKPEKALKYCLKTLALDSTNVVALANTGRLLAQKGDHKNAIDFCNKVLQIDPSGMQLDTAIVWNNLAVSCYCLNKIQEAEYCYEKAIGLEPNPLRKKEMFQLAISCYDHSCYYRPDDIGTLYDKAFANVMMSQYEKANECYDKILRMDPIQARAIADKGLVMAMSGHDDEAIPLFDRALRIEPQNTRILINKGYALKDTGDDAAAQECFDDAKRISLG